jgi:NAD(P)-dependent dehydrogenase (short-subunit alcohol dehydrogenase family)
MKPRQEYTLITGSTSGVGESLARRLAASDKLILHGRDLDLLSAIRSDLPDSNSHLVWPQDLEQAADMGTGLGALLGDSAALVHSFVHCAEVCRSLPLALADSAAVHRIFQITVFSATTILRTLLKKTVNQGALRSVVFVSSIASRFGARDCGIYAATKGALDSLSRSLAVELAPNVRVNSILAGDIQSASMPADGYLMGAGCAEDIAAMAEYLISDQARWISGQQFVVDGGKTAH